MIGATRYLAINKILFDQNLTLLLIYFSNYNLLIRLWFFLIYYWSPCDLQQETTFNCAINLSISLTLRNTPVELFKRRMMPLRLCLHDQPKLTTTFSKIDPTNLFISVTLSIIVRIDRTDDDWIMLVGLQTFCGFQHFPISLIRFQLDQN